MWDGVGYKVVITSLLCLPLQSLHVSEILFITCRRRLAYCTKDECLHFVTCNKDEDVWLSILCELEHIP